MKHLSFLLLLYTSTFFGQSSVILDANTKEAIPFATISFGDGRGTFAGDEGEFYFTKKKYPDIDSLFISAIGYKEVGVATLNLPSQILVPQETNLLSEVVVSAPKKENIKPEK
jgi:hypothetical protein